MKNNVNVALIGNPNVGKTSVFNALTGLNHKIGNYPGITVDKISGVAKLTDDVNAKIIDLPGTYSINASSLDERIVLDLLFNPQHEDFPDVAVVVADIENLKRNLLLFTQVKELGIPTVLAINMADRMSEKGITLDIQKLEEKLKTKVVLISAKKKQGIDDLKTAIGNYREYSIEPSVNATAADSDFFGKLALTYPAEPIYKLWMVYSQDLKIGKLTKASLEEKGIHLSESEVKRLQQKKTIKRYQFINDLLKEVYKKDIKQATDLLSKADRVLTHKVWGYVIFFAIMLLVFQAIFTWSSYPMDWIDNQFANLSTWVHEVMEPGKLTDLIADGIVPGIGGIMPFIPQIAILFMFISILEETGYMSRVVFLMDRLMRPFGLSGKSVVPLISGNACAIPAIMSARNIENPKERLLTILVTPLTTCSARIPVYIILIALVIPDTHLFGFLSLQALTLTLFYLLGFLSALFLAWVLKFFIRSSAKSYFVIEMPEYRVPIFQNVVSTMYEKTKAFVLGAGKIIFFLSIIIWFLGAHGPGERFENAEEIVTEQYKGQEVSETDLEDHIEGYKLENSYIGIIGKSIEPVIKPLGYDWKIGIAVITSFVAREVFVGTLATIYNVGSSGEEDEDGTIKQRMSAEVWPDTGKPVFTLASGLSLMVFYAFAMQCASTVAITRRETKSWKWTIFQLVFLTAFAYFAAMLTFQLLK
ncbi:MULTISPECIES: ferrous iron transport protein B [Myroides]|uniref:Ferrous iron transport protein B n=1 Tax=Myroides albus TaxID=2562892 RepID=A0A6I3LKY4_9FLAO|nr:MULTISPECIES: ferrous iron transport protein B [Myroides]MTG96695.1 ferrous iron transport protein B [Myroides albus]MVX34707.1 ferrous iron transport protein B [Myroides sp. LoEW2-1]UVD80893.1 ferrous iron transport protein B [Myroides albus]